MKSKAKALRALTVHPVWAWAIANLGKNVENRTWRTKHRGRLAIHASARKTTRSERRRFEERYHLKLPENLPNSEIVCVVEVVDCVRGHPSRWAIAGHWHWLLANVKKPRRRHEVAGRLGLWSWTPRRRLSR